MASARAAVATLESVLRTAELNLRPTRPPDFEAENRALVSLAQAMAESPATMLQSLAETIRTSLRCGSAGVSLLADDGASFYWPAIAGDWKSHIGGGTPRDFGPCGDVFDRNSPLMFGRIAQRYSYFQSVTPAVREALLAPFYIGGHAVGAVWAVLHDDAPEARKFDREDLRLLVSMSTFAAAASKSVKLSRALGTEAHDRHEATQSMREMNEVLLVSSVRQHELADRALKAEAQARENERKYRELFNSIDEGFCVIEMVFDPHGAVSDYTFLEVNQAFERQSGLHDVVGKNMRQVAPNHESHWFATYGQVATTGDAVRITAQAAELDRWFDLYAFRVGGSQSAKVAVIFNDISERVRMAAILSESEVRYRRLFQASKDGILILDAQSGAIIDANAFMSGLLGQDLHELVGKELWQVGIFKDESASKAAFKELRQSGYIRYDHLPARTRDGEIIQVELVANTYQEETRLVAQCNVRDISARMVMERMITQQAESLADQARHKDEFLAMLSHELRNPLAPIRSATHLLRLQEHINENPIQQQAREVIERQVTNLTRLISDLMEVSRALTGRIRLDTHTVDLHQIIRHAIETATPLIEQRRHTLTSNLGPTPLWSKVDATRMEEVFVNLLINAAKYTEPGGCITVNCERHATYALVRIRDNGTGIDPALLPRIFDLFTQADRTLDRSQGGLGIGLSLAHRLVELHGGAIKAHSDGPGKGSEFVVRLQLASAPGLTPPAAEHEAPHTSGLRVLVVDDNQDACLMLGNLLKLRGHAVHMAHTGSEAISSAQAWRPDVILLDIGLPEIDGYEVARRLRAEGATRNIKLIAVTGYGSEKDVQLGREAGFDAHLQKPADLAEVDQLLAAWTPANAKNSAPS